MMRAAVRGAARAWTALKVEMHGRYSVERMLQLETYSRNTSRLRALAYLAITPLPSLITAIGLDLLPLEPPQREVARNKAIWARFFVGGCIEMYAIAEQCRHYVPALPATSLQMLSIAFTSTTVSMAPLVCFAYQVGFPIPFTGVAAGPFVCATMVGGMFVLWRKHLDQAAATRARLRQFAVVVSTEVAVMFVYPAYMLVFSLLSGASQVAFALLLPVIKIVAKNWLCRFIKHAEDSKAEFVTFHAEVFHSMFVTTCLQNSQSLYTSLAITLYDVVDACLSLHDLKSLLNSIRRCLAEAARQLDAHEGHSDAVQHPQLAISKMRYSDAVVFLLETDERMRTHPSIRLHTHAHRSRPTIRARFGPTNSVTPSTVNGAVAGSASPSLAFTGSSLSTPPVTGGKVQICQRGDPTSFLSEPLPRGSVAQVFPVCEAVIPAANTLTPAAIRLSAVISNHRKQAPQLELSESDKRLLLSMSSDTRLEFVQKILQALYLSESLLLLEFVEVVVPCVYSTCVLLVLLLLRMLLRQVRGGEDQTPMKKEICDYDSIGSNHSLLHVCCLPRPTGLFFVSAFNLSNRDYYAQFQGMDADDVTRATAKVMAYVAFEAVSLIILAATMQRKMQVSALHQLAFVLEMHFQEIQSKLVLWVMVTLQSLLQHFGADYTFQFAWLRAPMAA